MPDTLTIAQASQYVYDRTGTRVSRQTVYNWIKTGVRGALLQAHRVGRTYYITKGNINAFLQACR